MSHSPEHELRPEAERFTPSIRLEFFRHDEKEKEATAGPREDDQFVRLTQKGREHSVAVGKTKDPHPEVGLVYGSPRERSAETALRELFANAEEITPGDSLEDIENKIGKEVRVGKKSSETKNLDFAAQGEYHKEYYEHYLGPKDSLLFLREKSDSLVRETRDMVSTSYSRTAGNVAELVQKYLKVLHRWERLATEKPEEYAQYNNELQRFLGSHQTVLEPFLMKVIEKAEGPEGLEGFLASLPDKNGFGYGQGFSVRIASGESGDPVMKVAYSNKEWGLNPNTVREIIGERDALNREITEKKGIR